ncbi:CocE/NonD family hydrolase [Phenylobacterium sp.]|uniref:CocE/NonD family hydrolase n=1 Tax=Phenylobacterium sp. TaxID=1871053 RepID=UPI0025E32B3A|nr:CocE/NonD family hydrolase [Phenylobacterium sp.]MBX3482312.1 CocE/NonD family hydrolase [Phenylobacterium sp.]MCW5758654.1 CocE/NonD family hydrolase [Phenylobacterium sp.]
MKVVVSVAAGLAALLVASVAPAQPAPGDIPARFEQPLARDFERREAMIPMRDGVRLKTLIVIPRSGSPMPIILGRTPYGIAGVLRDTSPNAAMNAGLADADYLTDGYIRVYQDIRGRHGSEGGYILNSPLRGPHNSGRTDQSTDTWDTIDWLVKNVPNNNGRVGLTGGSYGGLLTLMGLIDPHPALKAAVPMYSMVDGWTGDDFYHNGAFRQGYVDWMYGLIAGKDGPDPVWGAYDLWDPMLEARNAEGVGRRLGLDGLPAWNRLLDNAAYTPFWRDQALQEVLAKQPLTVPTLLVHGLFDQEDSFGTLAVYRTLEAKDVRNDMNFLLVGPWFHGQSQTDGSSLGAMRWGSDTSLWARRKVIKAFFDQHLKGKAPATPIAPVTAFETGANEWRMSDAWPTAPATRKLYLLPGGRLGFDAPEANGGYAEYVADPNRPVPYRRRPIRPVYGPDSTWSQWLTDDQRDFATRPDVATFVSAPLTEALTVRGDVAAMLFASTTGSDADWVVKLIDVYPPEVREQANMGGYELMISADIMRGRYREDPKAAKAIAPGQVLAYRVRMPAASHTFLPGHRIMVQVQSSWFPLYDRNPQTFTPSVARAPADAYKAQTQRIHVGADAASYVELPVAR